MDKKRVLLYYPPNKRSVAIETLCRTLKDGGHELLALTLTEKGSFHDELERHGIKTYSHVLVRKHSAKYFTQHARHLIRFCKEHKIDLVWSHLQEGNIIAVLAQPFLKAKVITFRHHAESAFYAEYGTKMGLQRNKGEIYLDKIINRFSKKIIVPSSGVWYGMEKYEGCDMKKVILLPYIYDFSAYPVPDHVKVTALREQYPCQLLLIMVSRMIVSKQHMPVFKAVKQLISEGLSVKMIVMDDGPLRGQLEEFINTNQLHNDIALVGFREDFVNYMNAAQMLIHPSVTEASNNVVKEMGLMRKAVAVCRQVGDFDDYIEDDRNGYFLSNDDLELSIVNCIRDAYHNPEKMTRMGAALYDDVVARFSDLPSNRAKYLELAG